MSMSDCEKCWETPCVCGYGYRDLSDYKLTEIRAAIEKEYFRRMFNQLKKEEEKE